MSADQPKNKLVKSSNNYLKYSGMVFQLLVTLLLLAWLGSFLDKKFEMQKPLFTAFLLLFGIVAYLIKVYFDLMKDSE